MLSCPVHTCSVSPAPRSPAARRRSWTRKCHLRASPATSRPARAQDQRVALVHPTSVSSRHVVARAVAARISASRAAMRCAARPCRRRPDNFLQISVRHHTRVTFFQTPLWSLLIVHIFVMRLVPSSVGPSPSQLDLELLREIAKRLGRPREQLVVVLVVVERS